MDNILRLFSLDLKFQIERSIIRAKDIRLKRGLFPVIFTSEGDETLETRAFQKDLELIFENATESSLYAYLDNVKEGFVTLRGGHRLGICGRAVREKNELINIKDISGINIRVAREVKGCAAGLVEMINRGGFKNTLIISPPGFGKTTLLRDAARIFGNTKGLKPAVIDSRFELGAEYKGEPQLDIGERSFLLSGYSREEGFLHGIRSLSSNLILCDEIGSGEDIKCLEYGALSGVGVIATAHGMSDVSDLRLKRNFPLRVLLNSKGEIHRVYGD